MVNLGSWMNKILVGWGVDAKIANTFDEMIIAVKPAPEVPARILLSNGSY